LVVLGVVAAAALLAWIVAYRIERPIRALKSGIEAVRNGHKDVVVTVDASREFTDLVAAFNAMVQSQHELEAQLRQAAKMETIGHLASGIIHDFNNHLAVISGNLELIESSLADCHPAREYLDAAADATRIMANLATQLLTFSRRGLPQLAPTDVHQIIAPFLQVLQRTCKKGIRIETRLEASDRMVLGDAAQLTNALLNLAINARDAMPDGGMLTLATANIGEKAASSLSAGVRVSPRYLRIEVADTGKGMDEATRRRAFEPFFTTKEAEQGTGLGLASVLSTVTRHRGSIRVESAPDQGSRFIILLPLIDPVD
ncbi:MAG: ATP-binding protein, partial [Vicinamibacteria bacterium]|nr:ATP-binding protein [Vicinamibacteria bacterium]